MERLYFFLYNIFIIPVLSVIFNMGRFFVPKIRESIEGRKNIWRELENISSKIEKEKIVILLHCASMGEYEQARPLISAIKEVKNNAIVVLTFLSPSGYNNYKKNDDIDHVTYLPFDSARLAKRFFDHIHPALWIIVKHDLWLNHIRTAVSNKIPLILIDANLPPHSRRLWPFIRSFYALCFNWFKYILPVSEEDRARFITLGVSPEKLITTGDTRYDQVIRRSRDIENKELERVSFYKNKLVFVGGSVWPSDTEVLVPAIAKTLSEIPSLQIILVPHEPTEEHVSLLEQELRQAGLNAQRYSGTAPLRADKVLIVDAIGILAHVYKYASVCYVGGSFGPGVHNVMEPAILESPVLFGPRHRNSFEAIELIRRNGGFEIKNSSDAEEILIELLKNENKRMTVGENAAAVILKQAGATDRIMKHLKELLP